MVLPSSMTADFFSDNLLRTLKDLKSSDVSKGFVHKLIFRTVLKHVDQTYTNIGQPQIYTGAIVGNFPAW